MKLEISGQILKNTEVPNVVKMGTVGAESSHSGGRTESWRS